MTELFIIRRKLNIYMFFVTQSYFTVPKDVRRSCPDSFSAKTPNKREFQQIAINHSSDIDFEDCMNIYTKCTAKPYIFLVNDSTPASDNPLRFRNSLL